MPDVILPRRSFLAAFGLVAGTLALGIPVSSAHAAPGIPSALPTGDGLTAGVFVHIAPDGTLSILCHRSEMGQGIRSTLPVLIADEMGADMAKVKVLQADGDVMYGDQNTDGSSSVRRGAYEKMRQVGATARTMLIAAAAKKWNVPAASCSAQDHVVTHAKSKRSLGFGELAVLAAKMPLPKPKDVELRPRAELRRVGGPLPLLDGPDIVTGRGIFGADVRLPGMLTASIERPPDVGGKVARFDGSRALKIPGVKKVLELPALTGAPSYQALGGVAVLADNTWAAMRGRAQLDITWAPGDNASYDSAHYRETLLASVRAPGKAVRNAGNVDAALAKAARKLEAEYHVPHLSHVPMEPPAAVARVDANGCEVWACTQHPQRARDEVAKALGMDPKKVAVHVTLLGGGFGRKSKPDYCVEAALLSKAAGVPVRVIWTREDDVRHGYYHSVCTQKLVAGLDERGKVIAWLHRTAFPPIGSTFKLGVIQGADRELQQGILDRPLAVPNVRAEVCDAKAHVRIGWLRSVHNINHGFAVSSFIDEIAHARGEDPRDVLLELLGPARIVSPAELGVEKLPNYDEPIDKHPVDAGRFRKVVERVTELSRWSERGKGTKRALGLAVHRSFVSYVAVVVAVVPNGAGKIRVDEAWIVSDTGTVLHPDRVKAQMEGAVVFGMSLALHGSITMKNGAVEQSNYRDYPVARIGEVPRNIHVDLIPSEGPPGGVGEPGVPPVAPAIANAVFALTGKRVRDLPLARHGLV